DKPFHHAFGLELAKAFSQNAIADSRDASEQLIETRGSRKKSLDHRPGPAFPYQLDRALKGRAVVEAPSDHGERFYALSGVSESAPQTFSTRKLLGPQSVCSGRSCATCMGLGKLRAARFMEQRWS